MELVIWESIAVGNACKLDGIENVDGLDLVLGVPMKKGFPSDVRLPMSKRHKKDTGLTDDLSNSNQIKVCSARLTEFLRKKRLKNVEYLPVTILDHKGKVASKDYSIVHPVGLQDALDVKASKPTYSPIIPTEIDEVKKLVVDVKRVDPEVRLFRLKSFNYPVLVDRTLAREIQAGGFVGPSFVELEDFE
jgi:hypothetical protein